VSATQQGIKLWEGAVIPFVIDPNFDDPARVREAIRDHYESRTNLRFVQRSAQSSFLLFRNGQKCNSDVGFQGEPNQPITCVPDGDVSDVIHEIGHAVGLIHEHKRRDRDLFVEVREENIQSNLEHNFEKREDSVNLTDYDRQSIMHYASTDLSANGQPTLVPVGDPTVVLDNSVTFTASDLDGLNELYPHVGIVRRSDSGFDAAGGVREIDVANAATPSDLVTAVRTSEGIQRLILWRVDARGGVRRVADSANQVGEASSISIARGRQFVTACRTSDGNLKLISWTVTDDSVDRDRDSADQAGRASKIRILALSADLFVTACRAGNGALTLITWRLLSNGALERLRDTQAGAVSEISLLRVRPTGSHHLVATTVRTTEERIKTIVWKVASTHGGITRLSDSGTAMGGGSLIESAVHPGTGLLVVSCRTNDGILRLITLTVSPDGGSVRRRKDSGNQAGAISSNALLARSVGALSGVRASDGRIRLILWRIDTDGTVTRLGDSSGGQAGEVGLVCLAGDTGHPEAPIVTCVQTADRDLRLISWDDEPANGELD
jgi:astacin (peptidase family M12A)